MFLLFYRVQAFRSNVVLETANTGVIHVGFRGLKVDVSDLKKSVFDFAIQNFAFIDSTNNRRSAAHVFGKLWRFGSNCN